MKSERNTKKMNFMKFQITPFGIKYKAPIQKSIDKMEDQVAELCRKQLKTLYGNSKPAILRLESELAVMKQANTAFEFLMMREISNLSHEEGYPIFEEEYLTGSLIAFLLGITSFNPLLPLSSNGPQEESFAYTDMIWASVKHPKQPSFSIVIAKSVKDLISLRLTKKFGDLESSESQPFLLSLRTNTSCDNIGKLAKLTGELPKLNQFGNEVYISLIKDFADNYQKRLGDSFVKELKSITECDFYVLTQILGYIHGSFFQERTTKDLLDPGFFKLRDEFLKTLLSCGIPDDIAFDFVKNGVWNRGAGREKYTHILEEYAVPQDLKDYYNKVENLWPASACVSRLEMMCTMKWYQINYPKEFASVYQDDLEKSDKG